MFVRIVQDIKNVKVDDLISVNIKNGVINARVLEVNDGE